MTDFRLQFDPGEIGALASRYAYEDDNEARCAGQAAHERGYYLRDEFLTVCRWKTKRSAPLVNGNSSARVEQRTGLALGSADESGRIKALLGLDGVGVPTGSTVLHFALPDDYSILDVRALQSLGVVSRWVQYPVWFWIEYLEACRRIAREHGVVIRTLDKALWQYSKELGSHANQHNAR